MKHLKKAEECNCLNVVSMNNDDEDSPNFLKIINLFAYSNDTKYSYLMQIIWRERKRFLA